MDLQTLLAKLKNNTVTQKQTHTTRSNSASLRINDNSAFQDENNISNLLNNNNNNDQVVVKDDSMIFDKRATLSLTNNIKSQEEQDFTKKNSTKNEDFKVFKKEIKIEPDFEMEDIEDEMTKKKKALRDELLKDEQKRKLKDIEKLKKEKEEEQEKQRKQMDEERLRMLKDIENKKEEERLKLIKLQEEAENELMKEKERIKREKEENDRKKELQRKQLLEQQMIEEEEKEREFQEKLKKMKQEKEAKEKERKRLLQEQEDEEERQKEEIERIKREKKKIEKEREREKLLKEQEEEDRRLQEELEKELEKQKMEKDKIRRQKEEELKKEQDKHEEMNRLKTIKEEEENDKTIQNKKSNIDDDFEIDEVKALSGVKASITQHNKQGKETVKAQNNQVVHNNINNSDEDEDDLMAALDKMGAKNKSQFKKPEIINDSPIVIEKEEPTVKSGKNDKTDKVMQPLKVIKEDIPEETESSLFQPTIKTPYLNNEITHKNIVTNLEEQYYHSLHKQFANSFPEKMYTFKRRRKAILENTYFYSHLMGEVNLIDKLKQISRRYYITQEITYRKCLDEDLANNFNDFFTPYIQSGKPENYINKILSNQANSYNSKISPLQDFKQYSDKYYKLKVFNDKIKYYRTSISDGCSFYRLFIFSLLEYYILSNCADQIKKLTIDIYKIIKEKISEEEEKQGILDNFYKILYVIINSVENKNIDFAYQALVAGFNNNESLFDNICETYIRSIVYLIAEDFSKEVTTKYQIKIRKSINKEIEKDEIDDINLNLLINVQNEAFKYSYQLLPMIFNVDLNIFVLDGSISEDKSNIKSSTELFSSLPSDESQEKGLDILPPFTINLIYNLSYFNIAYTEDSIQLKHLMKHKELFYVENPIVSLEESKVCSRCKVDCKVVVIPFFKCSFCINCAKGFINTQASKRASFMNKENYHSREFYTNGYEIMTGITINEPLFTMIFKENIGNVLLRSIKGICFNCDESKEKSDLLCMPQCGCLFCKKCLENNVNQGSDGYIILNKFDIFMREVNKKQLRCPCNDIFNFEAAATLLKLDVAEKKIEAIKRMSTYVQIFCMSCISQMRDVQQVGSFDNGEFYKLLHVVDRNTGRENTETCNDVHVLCTGCIDKIKENDDKNDKSETKQVNCQICQDDHLVEREEWKKVIHSSGCSCIIL